MKLEKLVEEFQCPGCTIGSNTKCGNFKLEEFDRGFRCKSHAPGTMFGYSDEKVMMLRKILLGFPTGFNKYDSTPGQPPPVIRLNLEPPRGDKWDFLNVPVWALEYKYQDHEEKREVQVLLVRTFCPRVSANMIDVFVDGKLTDVPSMTMPLDVSKFLDKID